VTRRSIVADAAKRFADDAFCEPSRPAEKAFLHAVEIRLAHSALDYLVSRIRTWLDQQRAQPKTFRYVFDEPDVVLHVQFPTQTEARAFARAFGGEVLT
jgi:hypothetical protein